MVFFLRSGKSHGQPQLSVAAAMLQRLPPSPGQGPAWDVVGASGPPLAAAWPAGRLAPALGWVILAVAGVANVAADGVIAAALAG